MPDVSKWGGPKSDRWNGMGVLVAFATISWAPASQPPIPPETTRLADLAMARGIELGANLSGLVDGPSPNNWSSGGVSIQARDLAARHFGILSAGWQTYPGHSWIGPGQYRWSGIETFIAWCESQRIRVHGHGLGYGIRTPWLARLPVATPEDRSEVRRVYETGIRDTVKRFAGRVHVWDVCNEQLLPGYQQSGFATSSAYWQAYQEKGRHHPDGLDWYRTTFRIAHEADPKAKLILLDFNNEVHGPKSDTYYRLAKRLKDDRIPVHGVGFQMHLDTDLNRSKGHGLLTDEAYYQSLESNLNRFGELGLEVWITELDVSINPQRELALELGRQAEIYRRVMQIALRTRNLKGIKLWGVMDRDVWGQILPRRPYLFDEQAQPKAAWSVVRDELRLGAPVTPRFPRTGRQDPPPGPTAPR